MKSSGIYYGASYGISHGISYGFFSEYPLHP
jgi:hypothetical protein